MIQNIEIVSNNKHTIIELTNPQTSGFLITDITGITAPIGTINMTERAIIDGSIFNGARANSRNIVLSLRFVEGLYNVEELRHRCYQIFPVKNQIKLIFRTDTRTVTIDGYVETNDIHIFEEFEGSQISILCENSYFELYKEGDEGYDIVEFAQAIPLFEFPFENPLGEETLEFSELNREYYKNILIKGDIPTGFIIQFKIKGAVSGLTIVNLKTNKLLKLNDSAIQTITGQGLSSGDLLVINTQVGQKSIMLYRGSNSYSLLAALSNESSWLQLEQGNNMIRLYADEGINNLVTSVMYKNLFEGV